MKMIEIRTEEDREGLTHHDNTSSGNHHPRSMQTDGKTNTKNISLERSKDSVLSTQKKRNQAGGNWECSMVCPITLPKGYWTLFGKWIILGILIRTVMHNCTASSYFCSFLLLNQMWLLRTHHIFNEAMMAMHNTSKQHLKHGRGKITTLQ